MNLDQPRSDIDILVNSVTNAGENLELDSHNIEIGHLSSFISSLLFIPALPVMNDLCKAGNEITDQL